MIEDPEGWSSDTYNISDEEEKLEESPFTKGYIENYHESINSV